MSNLILIRGLPGSGKSSLAELFNAVNVSSDMFHEHHGGFKRENLNAAHAWCLGATYAAMKKKENIVVHNTFTIEWEMEPYFKLAGEHGYRVHTIIVENRHESKSIHDVLDNVLIAMRNRFQIKL